jgi:hypothetical protein
LNKQDYPNRVQNSILFVVYSAQYCSDKSGKEDGFSAASLLKKKNVALSFSGSGRGDIAKKYGGRAV